MDERIRCVEQFHRSCCLIRSRVRDAFARLACLACVLVCASSSLAGDVGAGKRGADWLDQPEAWRQAQQELASMGRGHLVWESSREGRWRIFYMNLDGTGLRRLSPDERNRDHFCPHLSPDGRRAAYLSYPRGLTTYRRIPRGAEVRLHLIDIDGSGDRVIAEAARAYFEDRAVVWVDARTLIYIDGDGRTRKLNVDSGESTVLIDEPRSESGYLINRTLTHATTGQPTFSIYDRKRKTVTPRDRKGGCQPYFTFDGRWGYWTSGAGGPLSRIDLESGAVSPIIKRDDPRLPRERNYTYFPMVSPCQRLFAFGASPDEHDHFRSDYDIFIAPIDPRTLELTGKPVRYTFDSGCDRYPDVYLADLELGTQRVEAPFVYRFDPQAAATLIDSAPAASESSDHANGWRVSFGDGATGADGRWSHRYEKPGRYMIEATRGDVTLRGRIEVTQAQPPRIEAVWVTDAQAVRVAFDEPVTIDRAAVFELASGTPVVDRVVSEDGRVVTLSLARRLEAADRLRVAGVRDRAQSPNVMAPAQASVRMRTWPITREGLVYQWQSRGAENRAVDPGTGEERSYAGERRGHARFDSEGRLLLDGGVFAVRDLGPVLAKAARQGKALTLEATITPANITQSGPARIISFSQDASRRNFTLGQDGAELVLRLRTPRTGENGTKPQVTLAPLEAGRTYHVIVTYQPGELACYVDGKRVMRSGAIAGDFANWSDDATFLLGDELSGGRDWAGAIEAVAVYSRALDADEARQAWLASQQLRSQREASPAVIVRTVVTAVSQPPTMKQIAPYREALAMVEHRVEKVLAGSMEGDGLRAAHWAILDGEAVTLPRIGQKAVWRFTPMESNGQLTATYQQDTLEDDFLIPLYHTTQLRSMDATSEEADASEASAEQGMTARSADAGRDQPDR